MFSAENFNIIANEIFSSTLSSLGARQVESKIVKQLEIRARELSANSSDVYVLGSLQLSQANQFGPDIFRKTICFETSDWFVEIFEYPGEAHAHGKDGRPCHYLHIHIGPLVGSDAQRKAISVSIDHAIPKQSPLISDKILWRYCDNGEMLKVFNRARDEIFIPFVLPILLDKRAVQDLLDRVRMEIEDQWAEEILQHNLSIDRRSAQDAFKAKDFAEYLAQVRKIPSQHQTKVDLARIKFASKRIQTSGGPQSQSRRQSDPSTLRPTFWTTAFNLIWNKWCRLWSRHRR